MKTSEPHSRFRQPLLQHGFQVPNKVSRLQLYLYLTLPDFGEGILCSLYIFRSKEAQKNSPLGYEGRMSIWLSIQPEERQLGCRCYGHCPPSPLLSYVPSPFSRWRLHRCSTFSTPFRGGEMITTEASRCRGTPCSAPSQSLNHSEQPVLVG